MLSAFREVLLKSYLKDAAYPVIAQRAHDRNMMLEEEFQQGQ